MLALLFIVYIGFMGAGQKQEQITINAKYTPAGTLDSVSFTIPDSIDIYKARYSGDLLEHIDSKSLSKCINPLRFCNWTLLQSTGVATLGLLSTVGLKKVVEKFSSIDAATRYVYGTAGTLASMSFFWGFYRAFIRDVATVYEPEIDIGSCRADELYKIFVSFMEFKRARKLTDVTNITAETIFQDGEHAGKNMLKVLIDRGTCYAERHSEGIPSFPTSKERKFLKQCCKRQERIQGTNWMVGGAVIAAPCLSALAYNAFKHGAESVVAAAPALLN